MNKGSLMLLAQKVHTAASEHSRVCNDESLQRIVKVDSFLLDVCLRAGLLNALTKEIHSSIERRGRNNFPRLRQQRGLQITSHGRRSKILAPEVFTIIFSSLGPFTPKGMKVRPDLFYSHYFVMGTHSFFYLDMFLHFKTSTSVRATDDNQITL